MPVKWTPEMDQQTAGDDSKAKPTPRAITERLVKIRSLIKTGNGQSPTSTPQKLATPSSRNRTSAKRKRGDDASTGKENIKTEAVSPTPNSKHIKQEYTDYSASSIDLMAMPMTMRTPSKRARVAPLLPPGMTTYSEDTDNETQDESSASEFVCPVKVEASNSYGNIHVHEDQEVDSEYA